MNCEPNLRYMERTYTGIPYGYGHLPVPNNLRPLGEPLNAVSRPQQIPDEDRDPGGHGSIKRNGRNGKRKKNQPEDEFDPTDLLDLWERFKDTFHEIPGLWRSILGILATPLRWLRWLFTTAAGWVLIAGCVILFIAAIPLFSHTGGRDARMAEAEQLMGSARDFCRVEWSRSHDIWQVRQVFAEESARGTFDGKYYRIEPKVIALKDDGFRVYAAPVRDSGRRGYMDSNWKTGSSTVNWE